ncbi:MAG: hypothetical protein NTY38_30490 [Acidobacteria bacterium]|nr:hypothetical protein [Acidobacteriota bacterium]
MARTTNIDAMVAPDALPQSAEVVLLDGRTHTTRCFRQKGNQGGGSTVERMVAESGEIGMVLPPEETTWGDGTNLPELLRRKMEVMHRHGPEPARVEALVWQPLTIPRGVLR